MKVHHTADGAVDSVRDEEGTVLFVVASGHGAKAVGLQHRCWDLNAARKYTAAARVSAEIEALPGYKAEGPWAELGS